MELHTFTTDPNTGYLDLPNGVGLCDGDCGVAWMENELTDWHGQMLCPECIPNCVCPGCKNKQHFEGNELCAKDALEVCYDFRKEHMLSQRGPMTEEYQNMRLYWDMQCALWEARQ